MLRLVDGIAAEVINILLLGGIAGIVYWIVKAVARGALVAVISSIAVGVLVAWVLFAGGLEFLVGETKSEANDLTNRTTNTIPYDFGE